jgi:acetylornithine deacetylase/succinyl-diaminopimelate desuccinylase-like protein
VIAATANAAATGVVVSVQALSSEVHSGMFGGPAPDALAALIHLLATLRDGAGNTTVKGLDNTQTWDGVDYPPERFRADACLLPGVALLGEGTVADLVWARPAVTVLGIDCPPVVGSAAAIQPHARRGSTSASRRGWTPPGRRTRWSRTWRRRRRGACASRSSGRRPASRSRPTPAGPPTARSPRRWRRAYGRQLSTLGQGRSIPLCNVFADTYPQAEIILMGVEEPLTLMHAPNESVHPDEIATMAQAEALFLRRYASSR